MEETTSEIAFTIAIQPSHLRPMQPLTIMNESDKDTVLTAANSVSSVPPLMGDDDDDGYPTEPPGAPPLPISHDGTPMYTYRDFGHIEEDDDGVGGNSGVPPPTNTNRGGSESSIRVQKFPVKLYAILAQKEFHDIICWMPHGRSWKVLKPSMFESLVMPLFFEYSNYHSFNRLVNAWSFRRISAGPDRGSYYHELFLRGKPHLQNYMRRLPKTHKKLPMKKKNEPDFYKLDQTNPLPAIHEAPIPGAAATVQAMRAGVPPQSRSPHTDMMLSHGAPMTSQQLDNNIVTPNISPHHGGASIIGDNSNNYTSSSGLSGGMNGVGSGMGGFSNINSMGPGSLAMNGSNFDSMGMNGMGGMGMNGNMGMNSMSNMNSMSGMSSMSGINSMNGMGMGSGNMGSSGMGMSSMSQNFMGSMGQGGSMGMSGMGSGNSQSGRYTNYNDSIVDCFQDEYEPLPQSMMGTGRGHAPQHMMSHSGDYGGSNNSYNKMSSPSQSGIRRPIPMRHGPSMDHMGSSGMRNSSSRQSDFYQGYSPNQQSNNMMALNNMNAMSSQNDMYSRSGSASLPGLQDEYTLSPDDGNMSHRQKIDKGPSDHVAF